MHLGAILRPLIEAAMPWLILVLVIGFPLAAVWGYFRGKLSSSATRSDEREFKRRQP